MIRSGREREGGGDDGTNLCREKLCFNLPENPSTNGNRSYAFPSRPRKRSSYINVLLVSFNVTVPTLDKCERRFRRSDVAFAFRPRPTGAFTTRRVLEDDTRQCFGFCRPLDDRVKRNLCVRERMRECVCVCVQAGRPVYRVENENKIKTAT